MAVTNLNGVLNTTEGFEVNGTTVINDQGEFVGTIGTGGVTPAYIAVKGGQHTTVGGDASETATVTGALATDIVIASIEDNGTNNVTLLQSAAASNAVNFTLSADPGNDAIINYIVFRATA